MKTLLTFSTLFSAAGVPATFAAELADLHLPAAFNPLDAFAAFVITFVLLMAFSDYSRSARARSVVTAPANRLEKASHALAA